MTTTDIKDLTYTDVVQEEKLDENNLSKSIVDLSLTLDTRIEALNLFYERFGHDETIETINKLGMMYGLSGVKSLKQYLFAICEKSKIHPFLKTISARALWAQNINDELAYKALDTIYPQLDENVGTPYRIELVKMLMFNDTYKSNTLKYFISIIDNLKIDCKYRYQTILNLEQRPVDDETKEEYKQRVDRFMFFITNSLLIFVQNVQNEISYRILGCQYLLKNCPTRQIEDLLLGISSDKDVPYNIRADATDVLLSLATPEIKKQAEQIIRELGVGTKKIYTVYENAQNVHTKEVDQSIEQTLEFLQGFDLMEMKDTHKKITFDYVQTEIMKLTNESNNHNVELSLSRIQLDRALYSRYNCNLEAILLKIWTYISGHESEQTLKQRLIEELNEMSGTCSSGYASRLINTISGFGDFGIRISWRDQIVSNFTARLNSKIRDMDNIRKSERILIEMTLETSDYRARKNFLKFLRENLSEIREELYNEFKKHIKDEDFELYFRSAVSMYESGFDV